MSVLDIRSVFAHFLAVKARELVAAKTPDFTLILRGNFPKNVPIHEDGSTEYDPKKKLVYFAVCMTSDAAVKAWEAVEAEFDTSRGVA